MSDTPTSLLSKAWSAVITLLGIVILLAWAVSIIQTIWPWLVSITTGVLVIAAAVLLLRRWRDRGRW